MKRYLFIINPVAGKGKALDFVPFIKKAFDEDEIEYDIKITSKRGHGEELAREGLKRGYNYIVSVGGDGTIYEVLNGIKGGDAILGIIPAGTGNDFARSINMPKGIEEIIETIKMGNGKHIDLGSINDRLFINTASVGIDAEIVRETEKIKKYISGSAAYITGIFATLAKYKSKTVDIIIDDKEYRKNIDLIAIGNGKYYGGGMKINPDADIEDGLLDICLVRKMNKIKFALLFLKVFKGNHTKVREVETLRGKNIKIFSDEALLLNADGDIIGTTPADIKVERRGIAVIVPREYECQEILSKDAC